VGWVIIISNDSMIRRIKIPMRAYKDEIRKYTEQIGEKNFEYSVNISLMFKYIYVETPKAGCSSIKNILQRMELGYPELVRDDFEDIHDRKYSPLLAPSQTCGFERLLNNPDYFTFCFVRNPYTRLLSAYLDKIAKNLPPKKNILLAMGKSPDDLRAEVSFEEFVGTISNYGVAKMNPHWRTQYYQTIQHAINYDFVGRMENFHNDCIYVLSKINKNYGRYYQKEIRHATDSGRQLRQYYTEKLIDKVYEVYEIDFEHFGYSAELPA